MALTLLPTAAMAEGPDPVAQIGEKTYATLKAAFEEAKNGDTVTLLKDVETNNIEDTEAARIIINKEITLNLNDKTIRTPNDMGNNINNFCALIIDADVTINATAEGGINTGTNGGYAINVRNGAKLTINGGTYYGGGTAVQVQKGTLIINDGHFSCEPYDEPYGYKYLINCIDAAWKDGTAKISIKGGTFVKFDPSNSASENPHGKFLAEGYGVKQDGDNYIVTEPVAAIGDTKYPTLAAAITAAEAGGTVTLLKDTNEAIVVPAGKAVTIDLNGKDFTHSGWLSVENGSNLILANGSINANIWVSGGNTEAQTTKLTIGSDVVLSGSFPVVVEGGTNLGSGKGTYGFSKVEIAGTVKASSSGVWVMGNLGNGTESMDKMSMNSNVIDVQSTAKIIGVGNDNLGVTIMGLATVNVAAGAEISGSEGIFVKRGTLNINGGTISGNRSSFTLPPQCE